MKNASTANATDITRPQHPNNQYDEDLGPVFLVCSVECNWEP